MPEMAVMGSANEACGAMMMNSTSVNLHAHGTNIPPVCHQDEVIKTVVNMANLSITTCTFRQTSRRVCIGIIPTFTAFQSRRF